MRLVRDCHEIVRNLHTLKKYRDSYGYERDEYVRLIKSGICFVVFQTDDDLLFGPSRFVGYANNDLDAHRDNIDKHGSKTNRRITEILGQHPHDSHALEKEYERHCRELGEFPPKTGSFGITRQYWFLTTKKRKKRLFLEQDPNKRLQPCDQEILVDSDEVFIDSRELDFEASYTPPLEVDIDRYI